MRILFTLLLAVALVGCENPVEPTNTDDDQNQTNTIIINIGGDDDHSSSGGGKGDDDDTETNSPPFLVNPGTQENTVGDSVTLFLQASDPDNDTLTWTWEANSAPRNLTLQSTGPNTAVISGVISSSSATDSPFNTRIIVRDDFTEVSTVFLWIVDALPEEEL